MKREEMLNYCDMCGAEIPIPLNLCKSCKRNKELSEKKGFAKKNKRHREKGLKE